MAARLRQQVAAHNAVMLAARERDDAVRSLAALSANTEGVSDETCARELEMKIAQLQGEYKGAADAVGPCGFTPLLLACMQGGVDAVTSLLALGADPAIEGHMHRILFPDEKYKCTPLMLAARDGHIKIVEVLLADARVDVNQASSDAGRTAMFAASYTGQAAVVKLLLAHDGIDANQARTDDGLTPLFVACQNRHAAIVKLLLAHDGIDANQASTDNGVFPLFVACEEGHAEIVTQLLAHAGIDANKATARFGMTALHAACNEGHTAIVKLLLTHDGVNVNQTTTVFNETPLHGAIVGGSLPLLTAQVLVLYGASLVAEDDHGRTPTQLAAHINQDPPAPELAEWLNAVSGWSQLRVAAGCRLYKDAAFLLRRGKIDPDDPATTSIKDIMVVVAASHAKPATLPWQNAAPICRATIKLVADATRGWHRATHWLHHKAVRGAVFAVLVVVGRLEKKRALPAEAASAATGAAGTTAGAPLLPIEIWLFAMRFLKRSWWEVEGVTA